MSRRGERRARPDLNWTWCDACDEHVREVRGVKHECKPRQPALPWPTYADARPA